MTSHGKRNGSLDFWKFIFALVIVIFHGKNLTNMNETAPITFFSGGSIAVEFFFIVSGALMANSASKHNKKASLGEDTFNFMKRKIQGLLPNVYVAWIIAFIVEHIGETPPQKYFVI